MRVRLLPVVFLTMCLAGCATTRNDRQIQAQQLQSRINNLEAELQRKSQEINSLENELVKLEDKRSSSDARDRKMPARLSPKQIQAALKNAGFYNGPIDGEIGPRTKAAIKRFQEANGLKADGIAGKRTLVKLEKYL